MTTLADYLGSSTEETRFAARLLQVFSGLAFLLAVVGIYGVVSFGVEQRTHDIGIRMALAADRARVQKEVVGEALRVALAGAACGLLLALLAGRLIAAQLDGVTALDLPTYAATFVALAGAAVFASWVPSRRAAALDPSKALRHR